MNRSIDWRWAVTVALLIVWSFAILFFYYIEILHKPFGIHSVIALGSSALSLLVAGVIMAVGVGLGDYCLPKCRTVSGLERLVLSGGIGLGLLSLLVLGLGMVGWLYGWLVFVVLLAGLFLSAPRLKHLFQAIWRDGVDLPPGLFYKVLVLFLGGSLVFSLLQALMPPVAWDSLLYHLTGPKLYIQAHRIESIDIPSMGYSSLIEMLFMVGLLLRGPIVAQVLHWVFALLVLAQLYVFGLRYFDSRVAWLSMALFFSVPTIVRISSWAYVDVALMFYELTAVYVLLRWRESRNVHDLLLVGLFCGYAVGIKFTAVGLILAVVVVITTLGMQSRSVRNTLEPVLILGTVAFLVTLPWLLKNWVIFDNPVYPFLFDGFHWDAFRRSWYSRFGSGLAYTAPWRLLAVPWDISVVASEGKNEYAATAGPLLLIGLSALIVVWNYIEDKGKHILIALGIIGLIQYLIWLLGVATSNLLIQTRLLFPIFPLLAILAGYGLERVRVLKRQAFAVDWVLKILVILFLGLELLGAGIAVVRNDCLAYLTGWETDDNYLSRNLGSHYTAMEYMNSELPDDASLYFWWEPRSYYCERECRPDTLLDAFKHLTHRFHDAPAIAAYLREEGYTHVLLYKRGMDLVMTEKLHPINEIDVAIFDELERNFMSLVYDEGLGHVIYRLNEQ